MGNSNYNNYPTDYNDKPLTTTGYNSGNPLDTAVGKEPKTYLKAAGGITAFAILLKFLSKL